jgi:hypothetical protein
VATSVFKVVKIVWADAMSIGEWKTVAELKKDEAADHAPCTSIGFLIKTTKQFYYVANTVSSGDTEEEIVSNGIMMIPRKWVVSFTELTVED